MAVYTSLSQFEVETFIAAQFELVTNPIAVSVVQANAAAIISSISVSA